MIRALLVVAVLTTTAYADEPSGPRCSIECFVTKAREKLARGDAAGARAELVTAYKLYPAPPLLFALGQVELQLDHPEAAIDYYEQFLATKPSPEDAELAQQAIGAARLRLAEPAPKPAPPPPPRTEHRWTLEDTGIASLGGATIVVGGALLYHAHRRGNDHAGTLADYDRRLASAKTERLVGAGLAGAGAIVVGVAVARWRLVDFEVTERGVALAVGRTW
ncbi:MAG TPA: tetratricopeptide repeat protein [Kofleriaceae bacterium]|nr:tetratricopeptide repeat protein [Kofleriaceae bacterium]